MMRPRLASAVLAAGLGFVAGCSGDFSLRSLNPFNHRGGCPTCESGCCPAECPTCVGDCAPGCPTCAGGGVGFEGPILTPPDVPALPTVPAVPAVPVVPEAVVPPVSPAPRLVPTPAAPMPYTP